VPLGWNAKVEWRALVQPAINSERHVHIFLSIVFALLALNLIGFIFTICGFDLGWPFLLGGSEATRAKERFQRRRD